MKIFSSRKSCGSLRNIQTKSINNSENTIEYDNWNGNIKQNAHEFYFVRELFLEI
jgi:hypothetical protein